MLVVVLCVWVSFDVFGCYGYYWFVCDFGVGYAALVYAWIRFWDSGCVWDWFDLLAVVV